MVIGMPGDVETLGECQICGDPFLDEMVNGSTILVVSTAEGQKIALHEKCKTSVTSWEDLPDGPLKRAYLESQNEATNNE